MWTGDRPFARISEMDEKRAGFSLKAPGRPGSDHPRRLPGRGPWPGVDDHLVQPEITRDEIIGGRRVVASPAQPPHATRHTQLDYVIRALVTPGFTAAADLLTRHDHDSDFATDVCIFKDGADPATGTRYLEEVAFEVVSEQNARLVTEKAVRMHRRGVRRIFAVRVKKGEVCEWSPESQGWNPLDAGARIEDPCLVAPLAVAALLDAVAADKAVAEALIAKGDPTLREREARGIAGSILTVLEARGIAVSPEQRQEIQRCHDLERLDRWLRTAALASSVEEVLPQT